MLFNVNLGNLRNFKNLILLNNGLCSGKSVFYRLLLCALCFVINGHSLAEQTNCIKTLSVSAVKDWPPYSYVENEKFTGLDIELLEALFAKNNLCAKYVNYPSSSRAIAEFKKGNVDVISAASLSTEREAIAEISVAYRHEVMGLFARRDTVNRIPTIKKRQSNSFGFLKNQVIAINRGSVFGTHFDAFLTKNTRGVIKTNLAHERISLLKRGRVDFVVEDRLTGLYIAHSEGLHDEIVLTDIVINDNDVHYMIRPGVLTESELKLFNQSISDSYKDNQSLMQQYMARYQ